jgi:hypothetical protein
MVHRQQFRQMESRNRARDGRSHFSRNFLHAAQNAFPSRAGEDFSTPTARTEQFLALRCQIAPRMRL